MQSPTHSTTIVLAFLMIPFGIAIYQDANAKDSDYYGLSASNDYSYDSEMDYDRDYRAMYDGEMIAALEALETAEGFDYDDFDYGDLELEQDEPESMGASFFDLVFFDQGKAKGPLLAGPFAGLKFEAATGSRPGFEDWAYSGIPDHENSYASFEFQEDRLIAVSVEFPDDGSALRSMTAQWGEASVKHDDDSSTATWLNSNDKIALELETTDWDDSATATLSRYQTLEDLIAPKSKLFGFESGDLLLLSPAQVRALPGYEYDQAVISQASVLGSEGSTEVVITMDNDKVERVELELELDPAGAGKLQELLQRKLGKPKTSGDEWSSSYTFSKGKRVVELSVDDGGWCALTITRR